MKKFLLMLVAFVATMSAFAQNDNDLDIKKGWAAAFKPVAEADDLNGVHVAQAGDGSVYVSSTPLQARQCPIQRRCSLQPSSSMTRTVKSCGLSA